VPDEGDQSRERCGGQIAPVPEGGRRHGADDEVAQDSTRARRREGDHEDPEEIDALTHGGRGARESEHEHADEVDD
jgi:hypothetical protein